MDEQGGGGGEPSLHSCSIHKPFFSVPHLVDRAAEEMQEGKEAQLLPL